MESGYLVSYNGLYPWGSGRALESTPYVSVEVQEIWVAGQLGTIRTVTLNGIVPSGGLARISGITSAFANNFKAFSAPNIYMPNAMVENISFGQQNYIGKVDYSITLRDFSGFLYGVNNPVDEINFDTETDGSIRVSHKISAIGIPTGNYGAEQAFNNARSFVSSRTGVSSILAQTTYAVNKTNISNIFLTDQQETINRAIGSYGITETWKYDPLRDTANSIFKRISIDFNSGINQDYVQVSIGGNYLVGKDIYSSGLLASVIPADLYNWATAACPGLNPLPLSFSVDTDEITESGFYKSLSARAMYDNSVAYSWFDYDIDYSKSFKDGIGQVGIKGQIMGSGRHVRRRYQSALAFFNDEVGGLNNTRAFLYAAAMSGITDLMGPTAYPWNPTAKTVSVMFNSGQGTINLQANFDDAPFVSGYSDFSWDVSADCGLNVFKPHISANKNGSYVIQDLNILNRTSVNIGGNFIFPETGAFTKTTHNTIFPLLSGLEGAVNAFAETDERSYASGESIKTGFVYSYTKDNSSLVGVLPPNGKIYIGTRT